MSRLVALLALAIFACAFGVACAQPSPPRVAVLGDWHGTSVCLVRPSACHDEEALYIFTTTPSGGIAGQFDKIVNGQPESMGPPLDCTFQAETGSLRCPMARGGYVALTLAGDSLDGGMFLGDGTHWRDIRLTRR